MSCIDMDRIGHVIHTLVQDLLKVPAKEKEDVFNEMVTDFYNVECVQAYRNDIEARFLYKARSQFTSVEDDSTGAEKSPRDLALLHKPAHRREVLVLSEFHRSDNEAVEDLLAELITLSEQRNDRAMRSRIQKFYNTRCALRIDEAFDCYQMLERRRLKFRPKKISVRGVQGESSTAVHDGGSSSALSTDAIQKEAPTTQGGSSITAPPVSSVLPEQVVARNTEENPADEPMSNGSNDAQETSEQPMPIADRHIDEAPAGKKRKLSATPSTAEKAAKKGKVEQAVSSRNSVLTESQEQVNTESSNVATQEVHHSDEINNVEPNRVRFEEPIYNEPEHNEVYLDNQDENVDIHPVDPNLEMEAEDNINEIAQDPIAEDQARPDTRASGEESEQDDAAPTTTATRSIRRRTGRRGKPKPKKLLGKDKENNVKESAKYLMAAYLSAARQGKDESAQKQQLVNTAIEFCQVDNGELLEVDVSLGTQVPSAENYRGVHEYLKEKTCTVIRPDFPGAVDLDGPPTAPPKFFPHGPLYLPIESDYEHVVLEAGRFVRENRNTCWKESPVVPPTPNPELIKKEREFSMQHGDGRSASCHPMRLAVPSIKLNNANDVNTEEFKTLLHSVPISKITGLDRLLGFDKDLLTLDAIVDIDPTMQAQNLFQPPQPISVNRYWDNDLSHYNPKCWKARQIQYDFNTVQSYLIHFKKQQEISEKYYEKVGSGENIEELLTEFRKEMIQLQKTEQEDPEMITYPVGTQFSMLNVKFCTNINLNAPKFKPIIDAIVGKLPELLKPYNNADLLEIMEELALGINTVQVYCKTPGSRTCAHMENGLVASINYNEGPGNCIWYAVPYEYWGKVHEIVTSSGCKYNDLDYWPDDDTLLKANIPVMKFNQEAGTLVHVNSGTFHWVQADGFAINYSWNVGPPTFTQMAITTISNCHNLVEHHRCVIPVVKIAWNIAKGKMQVRDRELYNVVRSILLVSLSFNKMWYDTIIANGGNVEAPNNETFIKQICSNCDCEVYNLKCCLKAARNSRWPKPETDEEKAKCRKLKKLTDKSAGILSTDWIFLCSSCAEHLVPRIHEAQREKCFLMNETIEEMGRILDNFRLAP